MQHFKDDDAGNGIVVFNSLGKDAKLVVPLPCGPNEVYVHLASFVRGAAHPQNEALWQVVGSIVSQQPNDRPLWQSTAGAGVAWLHVRLDSRPKYYGYAPYRDTNGHCLRCDH